MSCPSNEWELHHTSGAKDCSSMCPAGWVQGFYDDGTKICIEPESSSPGGGATTTPGTSANTPPTSKTGTTTFPSPGQTPSSSAMPIVLFGLAVIGGLVLLSGWKREDWRS